MGFISHHKIEWRLVGNGVRVAVVYEFYMRDLIGPRARVSTEDPKVCFNLLVDTFCFAIRLRVVGSRKGEVIVKELS